MTRPGRAPRRRRAAAATVVALLAALLIPAGCGVPDSGPPVVVSSAPPGAVGGDRQQLQRPRTIRVPDPASASDPRDLVRLFLSAPGADPQHVRDNVEQFFTPEAQGSWHVDRAGMTVVRVRKYAGLDDVGSHPKPGAKVRVEVIGEIVGVLGDDGAVQAPPAGRTDYHDTFTVERVEVHGGDEWRIATPPTRTLLSVSAMTADYDAIPVYFASPDHQRLVPQLRYVWRDIPAEQRRTVLVDWLLDGPSAWLGQAVGTEFPEGTQRRGNILTHGDIVQVNLTSEAADSEHPALMSAQLTWTLRTLASRVEIRIEGRPMSVPGVSGTVHRWQTWKRFNVATAAADSAGYYLRNGRVAAVRPHASLPLVLSALKSRSVNSHIRLAALSVDSAAVAVVRTGGDGRPQLWLGETTGSDRARASYARATGLGHPGTIGQPSFLPTTGTAVVPVDGVLKFVSSGRAAAKVGYQDKVLHEVSVAQVAPSGGRIAVVAGGRLYVAPLEWEPDGTKVTVGRPRRLAASFGDFSDVAWTHDGHVVFGGRGSAGESSPLSGGVRSGAWDFGVDGVSAELLTGPKVDRVPEHVGAATGDPDNVQSHGSILLSAEHKILQVSGNEVIAPAGADSPLHGTAPFFPS